MQQTSDLYKSILAGEHWVDVKITIGGVEYTSDEIEALSISGDLFGKEVPAVGNVINRTLTVSLLTPQIAIALGAEVKVYACIYNREQRSEWLQKGVYYVDDRKRNLSDSGHDTTTDIVAFDALCKTDEEPTGFTWPSGSQSVLDAIAGCLGVTNDILVDKNYTISKPDDMTMREILGYIAAAYGGNIIINDYGHLDMIPMGKTDSGIDVEPALMTMGAALPGVSRVVLHDMKGKTYSSGNTSGRTMNIDCPWATSEMAADVLQQVSGYSYQPFQMTDTVVDPAFQIGDVIQVGNIVERVYSQSLVYGAAVLASLSAPDVKETDHSYAPNKNRLGGGGLARSVGKVEKRSIQTKAGLDQITDVQYDEEGNPKYAIAEAALYATIIDESTGAVKTARISASVVRDADGNTKSLAGIVADVIKLNGRLDITGQVTIEDGGLRVIGSTLWCSTINAKYPDFSDASEIRINNQSFKPKSITSSGGTVYTVLRV